MAKEDEELEREEPERPEKSDEGKARKEDEPNRGEEDVYELEPEPRKAEDDDDDEDERRKTRSERRRERGELYKRFTEQGQELSSLKERLARAEGALSRPAPSQERASAKDPLDEQIEDIERQGRMLVDTYNARNAKGELTPEQREELRSQARALENKKARLIVKQEILASQPKPPPPEQVAAQRQFQIVQARHPDVVNHPDAWDYARNMYLARAKLPGFRGTMDAVDEIMEDAREKFGFKKPAKPSQHMREQYSSTPRGSSGAGEAKKTYKATEMDHQIAERRYPHIKDERKRMEKYVQEIVRPALEKQKRSA